MLQDHRHGAERSGLYLGEFECAKLRVVRARRLRQSDDRFSGMSGSRQRRRGTAKNKKATKPGQCSTNHRACRRCDRAPRQAVALIARLIVGVVAATALVRRTAISRRCNAKSPYLTDNWTSANTRSASRVRELFGRNCREPFSAPRPIADDGRCSYRWDAIPALFNYVTGKYSPTWVAPSR